MISELVSTVYNEMEKRILNNYYKPDEVITEQGIAKEFNVSRTPVREVFQLLSANDLIYNNPKKGICVRSFTHKDILDIYDLRILMEGLSAKLCVENIDNDGINKINEIVLLQEMYLQQNNTEKIWELDDSFHAVIHAATQNRLLQKMLDDFHHYTKYVRKYSYDIQGRCEISVKEHKEIFLAIKSRNSALAENLMITHVIKVKNNILNHGY